jgi:hypothetical protein
VASVSPKVAIFAVTWALLSVANFLENAGNTNFAEYLFHALTPVNAEKDLADYGLCGL